MSTNLKNVNSFILNSYINTVNGFVGENIVSEVDEETASGLDKDTFRFFEKLSKKIIQTKSCSRNCIFRKRLLDD